MAPRPTIFVAASSGCSAGLGKAVTVKLVCLFRTQEHGCPNDAQVLVARVFDAHGTLLTWRHVPVM